MNNNSEFMPVECLNVPKVLFYDKQYEDLSMDAKLIYALLLDRKEMAIRNGWVDEYGDTYVIYPKQEIKKYLNISRYRIDQAIAELEEHDQMVEGTVPYPGKLCQFYVKDITDNEKQMEEDIMKKMKESNEENFCRASRFFPYLNNWLTMKRIFVEHQGVAMQDALQVFHLNTWRK